MGAFSGGKPVTTLPENAGTRARRRRTGRRIASISSVGVCENANASFMHHANWGDPKKMGTSGGKFKAAEADERQDRFPLRTFPPG
jgi:hypothetical protein